MIEITTYLSVLSKASKADRTCTDMLVQVLSAFYAFVSIKKYVVIAISTHCKRLHMDVYTMCNEKIRVINILLRRI